MDDRRDKGILETIVDRERVFDGIILHIDHLTAKLPNGKLAKREVAMHVGASAVLPVDDEGYTYLVRQYRAPIEQVLTGRKLDQKLYRYHTGYPGGLKEIKYRKLMQTKSTFAFKEAVRRMLPKGPLGYAMLKKLHAYAGPEHTHQAQKPVEYKL